MALCGAPSACLEHSETINRARSQGWIDLATGAVDLQFVSSFATQFLGWSTQPLAVRARMCTGEVQGSVFHAVGEPLQDAHAT
jgi:hypothetical protein